MKREIGGEFHLQPSNLFKKSANQLDRFISCDSRCFLTSSGRDSLKVVIKILNLTPDDGVLLPSYLCKEILIPFKEENISFSFYKINLDLSVDIDDIKKRITKKHKALLIIHYFGFSQPIEEIQRLTREYSLCLIEDISHSFLSCYASKPSGSFGDVSFSSFRKLLPIFDGSLLCINKKEIDNSFGWKSHSLDWILYLYLRGLSMFLKYIYLKTHSIPKLLFLKLFFWADKILNAYPKPVKISCLSRSLLNKFDFDNIISRRRANFQYLLDNWQFTCINPLFNRLPFDICPFGFPVLTKNRDYIRQELIKRKIYLPIHWNLPPEVDRVEFNTSWEISRNILTIPIDQRYKTRDMDYLVKQIEEIEHNVSVG